ncbi:sensor histidine kinase [Geothermobacter ehrlichii]|uniref:sensor histidine kinase n=1 Tax=Geothermobacter ehrlichii TaxID=213224 RepID=UPI0016533A01|nr:ATP-binding protein [Geothermobacter ehrlichii]
MQIESTRDPFFHDILARVLKEAGRVESIVRNLLAFARDTPNQHHPLDPAKVIEETLSLCQTQLVTSGIHLQVDTAPDLPCIRGNRQQLIQVLLNLISNARNTLNEKYPETDPAKILHITTSRCRHEGRDMVCLSVEDRGSDIPQHHLAHVKEPFFTTKPEGKGTGLGLSISHDIIKQHGVALEITSVPGEGTRIDIRLPIEEERTEPQGNGTAR